MASFELDRLFGLALTDARFFHRLRELPGSVVSQFRLSGPEVQAVMAIAPQVSSTKDLALRLDAWMSQVAAGQPGMRVGVRTPLADRVMSGRS